jgi:hypothetical protein
MIGASDEPLESYQNFFFFGHRSAMGWLNGSSIGFCEDLLKDFLFRNTRSNKRYSTFLSVIQYVESLSYMPI